MFSGLMLQSWEAATVVAVVGGVVGFFTVLRRSAFAAHTLPNGAFAGAAGASLIGVATMAGMAVVSAAGALVIGLLGRRARHDVASALTMVGLLATGSLFLSLGDSYGASIYGLLFGQVLGVSDSQLVPTVAIGAAALVAVAYLWRPLLLSSVSPGGARARGVDPGRLDVLFLLVVAAVTTVSVPVVGALLVFTLLVSPAAAAQLLTARPGLAVVLSVVLAVGDVWVALAVSYETDLPVGFLVGAGGAVAYAAARALTAGRPRRARRS